MRGAFFVVLGITACWSSHDGPRITPQPSSLEASAHDPTGHYWCSIDDDVHQEHHCEIARQDGVLHLTKLDGSDRIRGELTLAGDELVFSGERFCMGTECKAKLHGRFKPAGHGVYRGTFEEEPLVVKLAPMPAEEVGKGKDDGEGGDTYGGVDRGAPINP